MVMGHVTWFAQKQSMSMLGRDSWENYADTETGCIETIQDDDMQGTEITIILVEITRSEGQQLKKHMVHSEPCMGQVGADEHLCTETPLSTSRWGVMICVNMSVSLRISEPEKLL